MVGNYIITRINYLNIIPNKRDNNPIKQKYIWCIK